MTTHDNDQSERHGRNAPRDSLTSAVGDETDSSDLPRQNQNYEVDLYKVLAEPRRRRIMLCLAMSNNHQMTIRQLGSHIKAIEDEVDPLKIDRSESTTVRHSIKRYHLPTLASLDIVTVDREIVQAGDQFGTVLATLCFVEMQRI